MTAAERKQRQRERWRTAPIIRRSHDEKHMPRRVPALFTRTVVRRWVKVDHRETSVTVEDAFWAALCQIAAERRVSTTSLLTTIDADRHRSNFSSAFRFFVVGTLVDRPGRFGGRAPPP